MMNDKTNCYNCINRRNVPGSAHSYCVNPDPDMTGDSHGIRNGWFLYPYNFDPIWKTHECSKFRDVNDKSTYRVTNVTTPDSKEVKIVVHSGTLDKLENAAGDKVIGSKTFKVQISTVNINGTRKTFKEVLDGDISDDELEEISKRIPNE
jgi:hypothetical protein